LVLPSAPQENEPSSPEKDTATVTAVAQVGARTRILLAEDNPVNQLVAKRMLALLGWDVEAVETGKAVLKLLDSGGYDLILMDCMMPEMDGYETTAEVRRLEGDSRHTPIMAMTRDALRAALDRWRPRASSEG
jgi:CheY-like chemotaxis protein